MSTDDDETAASTAWLDDNGLLHQGSSWVALPDTEWRLVAALLSRSGQLVGRDELARAAWPDNAVTGAALNSIIKRTRRRLAPFGLTITTVRGRGFVVDTTTTTGHTTLNRKSHPTATTHRHTPSR